MKSNSMLSTAFLILNFSFSIITVWLGALSLRGGFRFLAYVRQEIAKPVSNFAPFATVFAPCRGLDQDLRQNLRALFVQNYPAYEIVFAVDDARDAAVAVIEDLRGEFAGKVESRIVVAGKAVDCGQKVHNLRAAVLQASEQSEIFVFVDSDARPNENWLRNLVAPLADENVGAATGYRWFVSRNRGFASELRAVWNASIASALGARTDKNFCWGGATAIRRATFERIEMPEKWRGTLSDDFALTRALQAARLPIRFVPRCLTVSIEDCTFAESVEFTTRQMKITRVYAAHLWKASLIGSLIFSLIFWSNVLLVLWLAFSNKTFWLPLAFALVIFALGAAKAVVRLKAIALALPERAAQIECEFWAHFWLWTLTPPLYSYNCIAAAISQKIRWRNIEYDLKSPRETVVINRFENSAAQK